MKDIVEKAKAKGVEIHFPVDYVIADKYDKDAQASTRPITRYTY